MRRTSSPWKSPVTVPWLLAAYWSWSTAESAFTRGKATALGESAGGTGQFALLNSAPGLGEIVDWLGSAALTETAEVSRTELDGEPVLHVRGRWTRQPLGKPFTPRQDGTLEVWGGADDHPLHRAEYTVSVVVLAPPLGGDSSETTVGYTSEVPFSDYNAEIRIEAPVSSG